MGKLRCVVPITDAKQVGTSIHVFEGEKEIARYEGKLISFDILQVRIWRDNKIFTFDVNGYMTGPPLPAGDERA